MSRRVPPELSACFLQVLQCASNDLTFNDLTFNVRIKRPRLESRGLEIIFHATEHSRTQSFPTSYPPC